MTTTRLLFSLLLATFAIAGIWAQPDMNSPEYQGCHFYHKKITPPHSDDRNGECGSNARSDSIDILNYAVTLDVTQFSQQILTAACEIKFTPKQDGLGFLPLDLLKLTVDSVMQNGMALVFDYNDTLLNVHLPASLNIGDTSQLTVYYHGHPTADPSGFGGFVFEGGYAYNLGIGLSSNPYNFGRSWHPCFDNFVERATYDFNIINNGGRKGYGLGQFLGETDLGGGTYLRRFRMDLPLPTYLVGTASSNYGEVHQQYTGQYGTYPMLLVGKPGDTTQMKTAFQYLPEAVGMLEAWFGPYRWGQVGYVLTTAGAMEHASLIAYPDFSIDGGPTDGMNRLMAHELGHHWWGNITTLSCPSDMWIKEGNAEYSAHLFFEYAFGKTKFLQQVKGNWQNVVKNAHLDDGDYLPLSGLPYENTYGTHTYNGGAAAMHNLRGYLGDSLFQQGMRSILDTYEFQSVDAELFRDQLTANTGVDMTSFFNDWIFAPGYSLFELDSVQYSVPDSCCPERSARLFVQQKLHHAPHMHTNVPLEITFFDENWQTYTATFMASGEFSEAVVNVPFQPVWQMLNDNHSLNLARFQDRTVVKNTGTIGLSYCDLTNFSAIAVPEGDSALVSFIHYLGPADPDPNGTQLSTTHYWRYGGIIPPGFNAKVTLTYKGSNPNDIDNDLTNMPEDSLTLAWRPRPGVDWGQYPYYKIIPISLNDGNGFIRIDSLLPGDYAFAAGSLPVATGVFDFVEKQTVSLEVFPNPAIESVTVQALLPTNSPVKLQLFDATGRLLRQQKININGGLLAQKVDVSNLPSGVFLIKISDESEHFQAVNKIIKK
ncbi:MAG: T9SS type A sorting domain-containing protein [Saprospiraceae bacterium]|nr:T9SS type A sorting domain-containing protein [Saprospiraceae bacterium]MCF8250074.1 T9SS type A sorting domain-containing protein [Saprospiraceae bacterium]MCF8279536.1 T9SS type A sorting domain-containing protein [Bacteroidales bacterium]MCF8311960.1 T9SS type A sorting domain-containing protein [Saprospiraceae bacterium]MCF8440350.1 T9SS type A sorting domain-containing protein [Saprospiraceae bacterium]